jgi:hypothetical protein
MRQYFHVHSWHAIQTTYTEFENALLYSGYSKCWDVLLIPSTTQRLLPSNITGILSGLFRNRCRQCTDYPSTRIDKLCGNVVAEYRTQTTHNVTEHLRRPPRLVGQQHREISDLLLTMIVCRVGQPTYESSVFIGIVCRANTSSRVPRYLWWHRVTSVILI